MLEMRVIRQKFQNFVQNEMLNLHVLTCKLSISFWTKLNILCLICINRQYPENCIEFDNDDNELLIRNTNKNDH